MVPPDPIIVAPGSDFESLPQAQAVYLVLPAGGRPYLGRTSVLRRRLQRLDDRWKLRELDATIQYWLTGSKLEQWLLSYSLARRYFPEDYERILRLPRPAFVKLIASNPFPRTMITTRLTGGKSLFYGPFPTRAAADEFEGKFLDLFQLRRCQEDLVPAPDHPGCIYGEMNMCLRPCQQVVTIEEYATEADRVREFLATRGEALLEVTAAARDRFSKELLFEDAARQHTRYEKIEQILKLSGDLARDAAQLAGVAATRSAQPETVLLWFLLEGCWLAPREFSISPNQTVSLDARLREVVAGLEKPDRRLRPDHLALLAKWYFSSWRDGEWLPFEKIEALSYRKLVNAIHRVAVG